MAFYSYLSTKIIIAFITKSYQDLFGVRSYINAIEKGLKEGLEQGRKEECFKNAKKMKQAGIAFDVIAQVTGLSIGEIASL